MSFLLTWKVILTTDVVDSIKLTSYTASFDDDGDSECEGNDTLTDITFIGEGMFDPC